MSPSTPFIERVAKPACRWMEAFGLNPIALRYVFPGRGHYFHQDLLVAREQLGGTEIGFGLMFEMPVVIAFLSIFGMVSAGFLWKKSKYAMIGIVVLAAVLSPTGDALNLMMWAAPMMLLYVISIGVAAIFGWRRKKKEKA